MGTASMEAAAAVVEEARRARHCGSGAGSLDPATVG
jgi:hypothetical protein